MTTNAERLTMGQVRDRLQTEIMRLIGVDEWDSDKWWPVQELLYLLPNRLDELIEMPYREYLVTPEWFKKRAEALERADHRCQVCNAGPRVELNVHHRTYECRGYEREGDLVVLCRKCHALFHGVSPGDRS